MEIVNFKKCADKIEELFEYNLVARLNDQTFTLVKMEGRKPDFRTHANSDAAFFVVEGHMQLELRERTVYLNEGDMFVVPKGTEYRPVCTAPVTCLFIARAGTLSDANAPGTRRSQLEGETAQ